MSCHCVRTEAIYQVTRVEGDKTGQKIPAKSIYIS